MRGGWVNVSQGQASLQLVCILLIVKAAIKSLQDDVLRRSCPVLDYCHYLRLGSGSTAQSS